MRALLPAGAVAVAALLLSGCLWWDVYEFGDEPGRGDPDAPLALFAILLIVGFVLLMVNLSQSPGREQPPAAPPAPPPSPGPPSPPAGGWQKIDDEPAPAKAGPARPRAAKARRRQP